MTLRRAGFLFPGGLRLAVGPLLHGVSAPVAILPALFRYGLLSAVGPGRIDARGEFRLQAFHERFGGLEEFRLDIPGHPHRAAGFQQGGDGVSKGVQQVDDAKLVHEGGGAVGLDFAMHLAAADADPGHRGVDGGVTPLLDVGQVAGDVAEHPLEHRGLEVGLQGGRVVDIPVHHHPGVATQLEEGAIAKDHLDGALSGGGEQVALEYPVALLQGAHPPVPALGFDLAGQTLRPADGTVTALPGVGTGHQNGRRLHREQRLHRRRQHHGAARHGEHRRGGHGEIALHHHLLPGAVEDHQVIAVAEISPIQQKTGVGQQGPAVQDQDMVSVRRRKIGQVRRNSWRNGRGHRLRLDAHGSPRTMAPGPVGFVDDGLGKR